MSASFQSGPIKWKRTIAMELMRIQMALKLHWLDGELVMPASQDREQVAGN